MIDDMGCHSPLLERVFKLLMHLRLHRGQMDSEPGATSGSQFAIMFWDRTDIEG